MLYHRQHTLLGSFCPLVKGDKMISVCPYVLSINDSDGQG